MAKYYILFMLFLWIHFRSHKNKELVEHFGMQELGPKHPKFTGIPESSGIFYAMGAALMFEGKSYVVLFRVNQEQFLNFKAIMDPFLSIKTLKSQSWNFQNLSMSPHKSYHFRNS